MTPALLKGRKALPAAGVCQPRPAALVGVGGLVLVSVSGQLSFGSIDWQLPAFDGRLLVSVCGQLSFGCIDWQLPAFDSRLFIGVDRQLLIGVCYSIREKMNICKHGSFLQLIILPHDMLMKYRRK